MFERLTKNRAICWNPRLSFFPSPTKGGTNCDKCLTPRISSELELRIAREGPNERLQCVCCLSTGVQSTRFENSSVVVHSEFADAAPVASSIEKNRDSFLERLAARSEV